MREAARVIPMNKPPAAADVTEWLPLAGLETDPAVNRPVSQASVDRIVAEFNPDYIGVLHVSQRETGQRIIIDGQHRVAACRQMGWLDQRLECKVYRGLKLAEEAALFVHLNDFRRPTSFQSFVKRVTAGEKDAVMIDEIVRGVGLKIHDQSVDGCVSCVRALERVFRGDAFNVKSRQPVIFRKTLLLIKDIWGLTSNAMQGDIILGFGMVLLRFRDVDVDHLRAKIAPLDGGPLGLIGRARTLRSFKGGTVAQCVAEVIVDLYNKSKRENKLPSWRGEA